MINSNGNKIGKWVYADYKISLYHSNSNFHAKVKNAEGNRFQSHLSFGAFGTCSHADFNWISSSAQNIIKDTIAVFPYPKGELTEIWVFEAIPSAAPHIYRARKTLKKEPSTEGYTKAIRYLEIALKIQKYNKGRTGDLEKAILATKKEFFLFQIEGYTKYLSSEEDMIVFRTIVKNGMHYENIFEQFLELVKPWDDEDSLSYIKLLKAVSCEFLDQPLLAAESYAYLAGKVSNSLECARSCLEKARLFFDKKDISYAYFLEQLNRETLIKLGLEELLFEKDAIRMSFEKALITLAKQSKQTNIPSCFICFNSQESDVFSWVDRILAFDLEKVQIRPISLRDLGSVQDYSRFQEEIINADRVIIICTPELKKKCAPEITIGVAQEIRLAKERYAKKGKAETISLLYFKGNRLEKEVEMALRKHYISKEYLALLVSQKQMPIEMLYTRLAIIVQEGEKKTKKQEMEREKLGESLEDRRPLTHESIFEPKQAIELEKLFNHDLLRGKNKRILIQGSAGIGKSTLCHYIAYRWAKKELFKEFDYLFWLPLRRLSKNIYSKKVTFEEYVAKECGLQNPQTFFKKTELREKTLILLDGYDELSPDTNINGCFYPILTELKNFPHVIITSRPQWVDFSRNCELEILGFDAQGVKEYVDHFFPKVQEVEAKKLKDHLEDSLIGSLAHIPINLEIFCSLTAADRSLFTLSESPTMTAIYIDLTDWLFKRFRIERNDEKIGTVIEESNAHEAYDVEPLVEVLKELAWEAMEENTLYLPADRITNICRSVGKERKLKLDLGSIRSVGPFNIESGQGVFIHLTFQEYFAAVYLAHSYEKQPKKAKELLEKIKFESRYRLVLSMTAGFLSQKAKPKFLSAFFEDLFSEPRDLAKSYELCLFAQCFEECLHPEKISDYKKFVEIAALYIELAPLQIMNFQLLNRNKKLLHHPFIVKTISEKMLAKTGQKEVIDLLGILAQQKNSLPNDIRDMLYKLLYSESPKKKVINALEEIAISGQIGAQEAQNELFKAGFDSSLGPRVREIVINALGKITQSGQRWSEEAQNALVKLASDSSLGLYLRSKALVILGIIAKSEQIGAQEAQSVLVKMAFDPSLDWYQQRTALDFLGRIAKTGQRLSIEVQSALIKAVFDSSFDSFAQEIAIDALGGIAKSGQVGAQEAQSVLVKVASDSSFDSDIQKCALDALGKITKLGQQLSEETESALMKWGSDSSFFNYYQKRTLDVLRRGAESVQRLSKEAQSALIKLASDSSLDPYIRKSALNAFGSIVGYLARETTDKDSFRLVLEICYLTQRALVISESQICISNGCYRELVPIEDIHIDYLKEMQLKK